MVLKKNQTWEFIVQKNICVGPLSSQLEQIISNLGIHNTSHHISHPVRAAPGGTFQISGVLTF